MKGQEWNSVVIHPKPKVDDIKKLIGEIQDKQEKHTLAVSKSNNGKTWIPPRKRLQWIAKKQSFQSQVKEKLRMNKDKVRKPMEDPIWTLFFNNSKCKLGVAIGIELINWKGKSFYVAYQL